MKFIILFIFTMTLATTLKSQETFSPEITTIQTLETTDLEQLVLVTTTKKEEIIGYIFHLSVNKIHLKTINADTLLIKWEMISSIQTIDKRNISRTNVYLPPNPQSSKYFLTPSGYGLKSGDIIIESSGFLFNHVNIGISDYASIQFGTAPIFLLEEGVLPVWVMPKVSIPIVKDKVNFGVGAFLSKSFFADKPSMVNYGLGVLSIGSRNSNVSFSLGYGGSQLSPNSFVFILSGMSRLNSKTYIMTENIYIPGGPLILSVGARSFSGRVGIDYGIFILPEFSSLFFPWLGFSVPLEKAVTH